MAYRIIYKKSVSKDLEHIDKAQARRILNRIESELAANPDSFPTLKGRFAGLRKFRIGDFRIVFAVLEGEVLVLRIGHRKDVYKR